MGGASSWYAMMSIAGFLISVWLAGRCSKLVGMSSIIFEVSIGILLGPDLGNMIPGELTSSFYDNTYKCDTKGSPHQRYITDKGKWYCDLDAYVEANKYSDYWGPVGSLTFNAYNSEYGQKNKGRRLLDETDGAIEKHGEEEHGETHDRRLAKSKKGKTQHDSYELCVVDSCKLKQALETATVPDIFTLVGHIGVGLMIFESGMHFDFGQATKVGPWATVVAILGTFLPILCGGGLAYAYGFDMIASLSCGVSLAPTSVGIALKLLHEADALEEYFGQAVMTAAFVDDVLSLVLFSILFTVGAGDPVFMDFVPLILGLVFMGLAIPAAVLLWPKVIKKMFEVIPETRPDDKVTRHQEVMFIVLMLTLLAYGQITHLCGTHLWGCFIAGMSFSTYPEAHHIWVRQIKRYSSWSLRIFFACTLAWSIPLKSLFSPMAFLKGSAMGIGPCIACKVLCGPFMGDARWVIGWAMVGRAEFAYFIAIFAKSLKMMDEELFAILIWALLYATIFAPVVFRFVLSRYMIKIGKAKPVAEVTAGRRRSSHTDMSTPFPRPVKGEVEDPKMAALRERAKDLTSQLLCRDKENVIMMQKLKELGAYDEATMVCTDEEGVENGAVEQEAEKVADSEPTATTATTEAGNTVRI